MSPALQLRRINAHALPTAAVSVATILLVLLSLMDFPFPWLLLFPGVEEPPAFVLYSGIVLGTVGLVAAVGLWMMKPWSLWATVTVCVLNFLLGAPGVVMAPIAAIGATNTALEVVAVLIIVLVVLSSSRRALVAAWVSGNIPFPGNSVNKRGGWLYEGGEREPYASAVAKEARGRIRMTATEPPAHSPHVSELDTRSPTNAPKLNTDSSSITAKVAVRNTNSK